MDSLAGIVVDSVANRVMGSVASRVVDSVANTVECGSVASTVEWWIVLLV